LDVKEDINGSISFFFTVRCRISTIVARGGFLKEEVIFGLGVLEAPIKEGNKSTL